MLNLFAVSACCTHHFSMLCLMKSIKGIHRAMSVGSMQQHVTLMFMNNSHIKCDWLDGKSQQPSVKKAQNNTAGLYYITIKDLSPRECHYPSTIIYVQMAPNLLLPPPPKGSVCVWRCSHCMGLVYALQLFNQPSKHFRKLDCLSVIQSSHDTFPDCVRCCKRLAALREPSLASSHLVVSFEIDFGILMKTFKGCIGPAPGFTSLTL